MNGWAKLLPVLLVPLLCAAAFLPHKRGAFQAGGGTPSLNSSTSKTYAATATLNMTNYVAAGANKAVYLAINLDSAGAFTSVATNNGVAMTQVAEIEGAGAQYLAVFRDLEPATGENILEASWGSSVGAAAIVMVFDNVSQTTPNDTPVTDSGTKQQITNSISSATTDLVIDFVAVNGSETVIVGADQTEIRNVSQGSTVFASSTEPGAATVTMSWDWSGSQRSSQVLLNLNNP